MARILQVCNTDFYLSKFLAPLVKGLVAAGHEVSVVCSGSTRIPPALLGPHVTLYDFEFPRANSLWQFGRAIREMRHIIREGRYDCVDSHNRNASIVARAAARLEGVPVNLYTAHGFYFHDDQSTFAHRTTVLLEAALAQVTDFTLSQSAEDVDLMTSRGYIAPGRISVIGNGIDTTRFCPNEVLRAEVERSLGLAPDRFRIVSTGRLVEAKGFTDLLEAFASLHAHHPKAEMLLIGGNIPGDISPYRRQFSKNVRAMGLDGSVIVTGITDRVEDYLRVSDAFVLASYREGLPRALLEAMSCELAVVATDIRGCREAVAENTGILFPPHDVEALRAALGKLHDDSSLRRALGKAARARVLEHFDERTYVAKQVEAINHLVGRP